jgi:hypothetical protein
MGLVVRMGAEVPGLEITEPVDSVF